MAKRTKNIDIKVTLEKIKECLSLLPGEQERNIVTDNITEIIHELRILQDNIGRFPGESDIQNVSQAIHTIVAFFDTLKDRPLFAERLFLKKTTSRKTKSGTVDIHTLLKQLEGLPTENITGELSKQKKDTLLELAQKMNITVSTKLAKDALVDKILKLGFANKRGYDLLSGKERA